MFLYLMRHGDASRPSPDKPPSLTPRGLADVKKVAGHFRLGLFKVDALWHSPLTRAEETALAFLEVLGRPEINLEKKEWLSPEGDLDIATREIRSFKGSLLVVSHLPFLPSLASILMDRTGAMVPPFPVAGMAAFEKGPAFKRLWTLDPQELR